jgi:hypothetical protein
MTLEQWTPRLCAGRSRRRDGKTVTLARIGRKSREPVPFGDRMESRPAFYRIRRRRRAVRVDLDASCDERPFEASRRPVGSRIETGLPRSPEGEPRRRRPGCSTYRLTTNTSPDSRDGRKHEVPGRRSPASSSLGRSRGAPRATIPARRFAASRPRRRPGAPTGRGLPDHALEPCPTTFVTTRRARGEGIPSQVAERSRRT